MTMMVTSANRIKSGSAVRDCRCREIVTAYECWPEDALSVCPSAVHECVRCGEEFAEVGGRHVCEVNTW